MPQSFTFSLPDLPKKKKMVEEMKKRKLQMLLVTKLVCEWPVRILNRKDYV